jgi:2-(1,2-epoxy-1,2-dihydrophenyl)acetyl-CoA isomerase
VLIERDGGVAVITLNRPEKLNGLSLEIRQTLMEQVPPMTQDPTVKAFVITGAGRGFCAGGDFAGSSGARAPVGSRENFRSIHRWVGALLTADQPVITAVNGLAVGAGMAIAMLGDIVLAARGAYFKSAFPAVGSSPDFGIGWTLPRAIGSTRAKEILLMNRKIELEEAERIGMITRIVEPENLMTDALAAAHQLAKGPYSIGIAKRLIRAGFDQTIEEYLHLEAYAQAVSFGSEDFAEGVEAYKEKRDPDFKKA